MTILGRIFKITSAQTEKQYIGSTTNQIDQQFKTHKANSKSYLANKCNYCGSFDIFDFVDAKAELVIEGVFEDKKHLTKLKKEIIKITPNRTNINLTQPPEVLKERQRDSIRKFNTEHPEYHKAYYKNKKKQKQNEQVIEQVIEQIQQM